MGRRTPPLIPLAALDVALLNVLKAEKHRLALNPREERT